VIAVLIVAFLVGLGIVALSAGDEGGKRIAAGAGIVAGAGLPTVVEVSPQVADPTTTTSTTPPPAPIVTTTTVRRPVATTTPVRKAPASITTTAPPTTVTTSTSPPPRAAASVGSTTTTVATTTTTIDPCRNSTDAKCGPFRFDPQPEADRPMTVKVSVEPVAPFAGQPMAFHITLTDPDGVSYDGTTFNFGNSGIGGSNPGTCAKFGPWDPPATDPASATTTLEVGHTYFEAGTYTATFLFDAGPFDCVDSVTGRGDRPYASSATGTVTVVVGPAS
jgi:hypothetical protein